MRLFISNIKCLFYDLPSLINNKVGVSFEMKTIKPVILSQSFINNLANMTNKQIR